MNITILMCVNKMLALVLESSVNITWFKSHFCHLHTLTEDKPTGTHWAPPAEINIEHYLSSSSVPLFEYFLALSLS